MSRMSALVASSEPLVVEWRRKLNDALNAVTELHDSVESGAICELAEMDENTVSGKTAETAREFAKTSAWLWEAALCIAPTLTNLTRPVSQGGPPDIATVMVKIPVEIDPLLVRSLSAPARREMPLLDFFALMDKRFAWAQDIVRLMTRIRPRLNDRADTLRPRLVGAQHEGRLARLEAAVEGGRIDPLAAMETLSALEVEILKDITLSERSSSEVTMARLHLSALTVSTRAMAGWAAHPRLSEVLNDLVAWLRAIEDGPLREGRNGVALKGLARWNQLAERLGDCLGHHERVGRIG